MKYLALIKYTPDACAAIAKEGLGSRRVALETAVQAQGGGIDEFWALDSFDWNVCFVMSVPDDQTAGVRVAQYSRGHAIGHQRLAESLTARLLFGGGKVNEARWFGKNVSKRVHHARFDTPVQVRLLVLP